MVLGAAVDALSAMTREAAARPDPRRTFGAPVPQVPRAARDRPASRALAVEGEAARLGLGGAPPRRRYDALAGVVRACGESRGRYLPGAQQLELLRRLNAGRPSRPGAGRRACWPPRAAGRGRPDLELVGAVPESAFGPAPVDPAGAARRRAGARRRERAGRPGRRRGPPGAGGTARGPSWWRRGYRLVGDPELADPLRDQLVARGRPPGGREPRVLVRRQPTWPPWPPTPGRTAPSPRASPPGASGCGCSRSAARCRPAPTCSPSARAWERRGSARRGCTSCSTRRAVAAAGRRPRVAGGAGAAAGRGRRAGPPRRVGARPAGAARRARDPADAPGCGRGSRPAAAAVPRTPAPRRTPERSASGSRAPRSGCAGASSALATLSTATWTTSSRAGADDPPRRDGRPVAARRPSTSRSGCCSTRRPRRRRTR